MVVAKSEKLEEEGKKGKKLCSYRDSYRGTLAYKSNALTTTPKGQVTENRQKCTVFKKHEITVSQLDASQIKN